MPNIQLKRSFTLRLDDGRIAHFPGPGRYPVDDEIAGHPFMQRLIVADDAPMVAVHAQPMGPDAPVGALQRRVEPERLPPERDAAAMVRASAGAEQQPSIIAQKDDEIAQLRAQLEEAKARQEAAETAAAAATAAADKGPPRTS